MWYHTSLISLKKVSFGKQAECGVLWSWVIGIIEFAIENKYTSHQQLIMIELKWDEHKHKQKHEHNMITGTNLINPCDLVDWSKFDLKYT